MATWTLRRMDELCEITSSKRIYAADYVSQGVPFYRGREITEKYKGDLNVSTELFITEEKFREIEHKFGVPKEGDLLLTSVGTLGSAYVVKPGDRFYFKDGNLTWFRHFNGLDSRFLYYWIGSPQYSGPRCQDSRSRKIRKLFQHQTKPSMRAMDFVYPVR